MYQDRHLKKAKQYSSPESSILVPKCRRTQFITVGQLQQLQSRLTRCASRASFKYMTTLQPRKGSTQAS